MTLQALRRHARPSRAPILLALFAALLVGACAGAAPSAHDVGDRAGDRPGADVGPTAPPRPAGGEQVTRDGALIVRTGDVSLEVTDLAAAVRAGRDAIGALGGYVELSEERHEELAAWAEVTYRLPVAQWDAALAAVRQIGKVLTESTNARDVTAEVVDLDARLANLRATEAALQAIMDQATTIEDVLRVQNELTDVRGEIERLTAQREHLADQAAMSTLAVTYSVPVEPVARASDSWDLGSEVNSAFASLVTIFQRLASLGIWLTIVVLPVVLPFLLIGWLVYRFTKRRITTA